jgi:cyclic nucleotide gated channel, plant
VLHLFYSGTSHDVVFFFQVVGALWYLLAFDRQVACWKKYCNNEPNCETRYMDCGVQQDLNWNGTLVFSICDANDTDNPNYDYGMFESLLYNRTPNQSFLKKYFYCLWWGLQNLRYAFI